MAPKGNEVMGLVLVLVVMLWGGATAQSGCTNALIGLTPCLNYVSGNSSTPASTCCSQLASVVQSQPRCLCSLLGGGGSVLGFNINQTLALALPGACNVQTPPVSQCGANGPTASAATPTTSPANSPADSSHETPKTAAAPSSSHAPSGATGGSKAVPSTNGSSSGGNNIKAPLHLVVFVVLMVSSVSKVIGF